MSNVAKALLASLAAHALLASCLALYLNFAPILDLPRLDLSAVEISFAEEEAPAAPNRQPPSKAPDLYPKPDPAPQPKPPEPEPQPKTSAPEPPRQAKALDPEPEPQSKTPEPTPDPPAAPTAAPRQARIDAPPRPLKAIRPDYPKKARQRGDEGDVTLELAIDEKGRVKSVSVVKSSGHPELDAAAAHAAQRARFTPAKSGQTAVATTARLTIAFKLTR